MKEISRLIIRMVIISAIVGVAMGATYSITAEPIKAQEEILATSARKEVLQASTYEEFKLEDLPKSEDNDKIKEVFIGKDESGNIVGATFKLEVKGYKPGIVVTVGVLADNTVSGVKIGYHQETPGLGAKATEPEFQDQFKGLSTKEKVTVAKSKPLGDNQILSIAGSTKTSQGVTNAVNIACSCYNEIVK